MYVVIVGGGRVGSAVARWLIDADHEVTVVEADASKCAALEEELGSIVVVGDGTEPATLGHAGANRADVFIAATPNDQENLVACQLAKRRFGALRTVSLVDVAERERIFHVLGIDVVVNTTELVVGQVQRDLAGALAEEGPTPE